MPNPDIIGVGPWLPDTPALSRQPPASTEALNVVARQESYGPWPSFMTIATEALDFRCQGAFSVRRTDGTSVAYIGTRDKLYRLTGISTLMDVSRLLGGPYGCPTQSFWSFAQFGDLVVAFNGFDAPQVINIDSGTNFDALGGGPPVAKYVAVVGDFLMAGNTATLDHVVYWSAINNAADWATSQVTQADNQSLPDGGAIQGIVGIEYTATIFQEFAIRRAVYEGPPDIFRFSVVTPNLGCAIPGSIANYRDLIFFCDRSGFFLMQGLGAPQPIGEQRVNRWFWNNVNLGFIYRVCAAIDVVNSNYVLLFPDLTSPDGVPNHMLLYCWALDRWTHVQPGDTEFIWSASPSGGWTIEDVAAVYPDVEDMPFPWDSNFWLGQVARVVGGFDRNKRVGYFTGPTLPATVDTVEANIIPGRKAFVRSVRPLVDAGGYQDGATPSVQLLYRDRLNDPLQLTEAINENQFGVCQFRNKARYHRARIFIPGGMPTIEQIAMIYPEIELMPYPWDSPLWGSLPWQDCLGVDDVIARDAGMR